LYSENHNERVSEKASGGGSALLFHSMFHLKLSSHVYLARHLCVAIKAKNNKPDHTPPSPPCNPTQVQAINRTALKIAAEKRMQITTSDNRQ